MKIKTKLLLGFSTQPLLILFFIVISWYQLSSFNKMNDLYVVENERDAHVKKIQESVKDEAILLRNLFLLNDKQAIEQEMRTLQVTIQSVNQDLHLLEDIPMSDEQRRMVEDMKNANLKYHAYLEDVLELIRQGQEDTAIRLIQSTGPLLQNEFFQTVTTLSNYTDSLMNTRLSSIVNGFNKQLLGGIILSLIVLVVGISFVYRSIWTTATRLKKVSSVMTSVANGSVGLNTNLEVLSNDENDDVARSFNRMTQSLEEQLTKEQKLNKENEEQAWIKSNLADITTNLSGVHDLRAFARTFLSKVVPLLDSCQAVFYVRGTDEQNNGPWLQSLASYAKNHLSTAYRFGEGIVGQAALDNSPILLSDVPPDYMRVSSGVGDASPLNIYVLPISYEEEVKAVIEIASFKQFSLIQQSFLDQLVVNVGIILENALGRLRLSDLLQKSQVLTEELQVQSEELQSQQEELRVSNEELEEQTQSLKQSEEKLQAQQEELEQTNAELREKAEMLEVQNKKHEVTNKEVERARAELEEKASHLTLSSQYKSEFLANMSHELRTPLNSLLLLSKLLADNQGGNLSDKQIQFAKTIYSSGYDLLKLINDILDLAKIESGKMDANPSKVLIKNLAEMVEISFRPIAQEKNIDFNVVLDGNLPSYIFSDEQRLQQVLQNLLSNAFKFTDEGEVSLHIGLQDDGRTSNEII
ncbi:MAG: histidine kinase dimerization/phospho-acceptor domain-containing protein, partial [Bacilli bacterium]